MTPLTWAVLKIMNGEQGIHNGERGSFKQGILYNQELLRQRVFKTENAQDGEYLKNGIFKTGNLRTSVSSKHFSHFIFYFAITESHS